MTQNVPPRFAKHIIPDPSRPGCWPWTGPVSAGYARVSISGKMIYVHRWLAEELHPGKSIRSMGNSCGDTLCVNPDHWMITFEGSSSEYSPAPIRPIQPISALPARVLAKIVPENTCLLFKGPDFVDFARVMVKGQSVLLHKFLAQMEAPDEHIGRMVNKCGHKNCLNLKHWDIQGGYKDPSELLDFGELEDDPFAVEAACDILDEMLASWQPKTFEEVRDHPVFQGFEPQIMRQALIRLRKDHLVRE